MAMMAAGYADDGSFLLDDLPDDFFIPDEPFFDEEGALIPPDLPLPSDSEYQAQLMVLHCQQLALQQQQQPSQLQHQQPSLQQHLQQSMQQHQQPSLQQHPQQSMQQHQQPSLQQHQLLSQQHQLQPQQHQQPLLQQHQLLSQQHQLQPQQHQLQPQQHQQPSLQQHQLQPLQHQLQPQQHQQPSLQQHQLQPQQHQLQPQQHQQPALQQHQLQPQQHQLQPQQHQQPSLQQHQLQPQQHQLQPQQRQLQPHQLLQQHQRSSQHNRQQPTLQQHLPVPSPMSSSECEVANSQKPQQFSVIPAKVFERVHGIASATQLPVHTMASWSDQQKLKWTKALLTRHLPQPVPPKWIQPLRQFNQELLQLQQSGRISLEQHIQLVGNVINIGLAKKLSAELFFWRKVGEIRPQNGDTTPAKPGVHGRGTGDYLWEHVLRLLMEDSPTVAWLKREEGLFCFKDSSGAARSWGCTKSNPNMSFEKMSRSIRQYYKEEGNGIIQKATDKPKLHYRFNMTHSDVASFLAKNFRSVCERDPFLNSIICNVSATEAGQDQ